MKSFVCALRGILDAVKSERHMRIHISVGLDVLLCAALAGFGMRRFCVLIVCIALVVSLELLNTALERACDAVTREKNESIRFAKDASAGAVLFAAAASAVIGGLLFFRRDVVLAVWSALTGSLWRGLAAAALIVLEVLFIIGRRKNK